MEGGTHRAMPGGCRQLGQGRRHRDVVTAPWNTFLWLPGGPALHARPQTHSARLWLQGHSWTTEESGAGEGKAGVAGRLRCRGRGRSPPEERSLLAERSGWEAASWCSWQAGGGGARQAGGGGARQGGRGRGQAGGRRRDQAGRLKTQRAAGSGQRSTLRSYASTCKGARLAHDLPEMSV